MRKRDADRPRRGQEQGQERRRRQHEAHAPHRPDADAGGGGGEGEDGDRDQIDEGEIDPGRRAQPPAGEVEEGGDPLPSQGAEADRRRQQHRRDGEGLVAEEGEGADQMAGRAGQGVVAALGQIAQGGEVVLRQPQQMRRDHQQAGRQCEIGAGPGEVPPAGGRQQQIGQQRGQQHADRILRQQAQPGGEPGQDPPGRAVAGDGAPEQRHGPGPEGELHGVRVEARRGIGGVMRQGQQDHRDQRGPAPGDVARQQPDAGEGGGDEGLAQRVIGPVGAAEHGMDELGGPGGQRRVLVVAPEPVLAPVEPFERVGMQVAGQPGRQQGPGQEAGAEERRDPERMDITGGREQRSGRRRAGTLRPQRGRGLGNGSDRFCAHDVGAARWDAWSRPGPMAVGDAAPLEIMARPRFRYLRFGIDFRCVVCLSVLNSIRRFKYCGEKLIILVCLSSSMKSCRRVCGRKPLLLAGPQRRRPAGNCGGPCWNREREAVGQSARSATWVFGA